MRKGYDIVTYSGFSIHDGTLLQSKSQYTTVKHSRQLSEYTYTSDPHGLGTLTPIEFFQQDLLWQSYNTHSHSCSIKLPNTRRNNPSSGYRPLAHHNGTPAYSPSLTCIYQPRRSDVFTVHRSAPNNVQTLLVL
jgi:hypothetical protein